MAGPGHAVPEVAVLGLDIDFAHGELGYLILAALAVVAVIAILELRGREVLGRFVSTVMQHRLATRPSLERRIIRLGFILACLVLGVLALMRPQTTGATETFSASRVSADIMVVLDVSRSMLADDAAPTRLDRAKAEIDEMASKLRGHRLGLIAFAGRAVVMSPLTPDYSFFRMTLKGVDTRSVSRGGTKIGTALRKAIDSFDPGPGSKLILLITDGEDHDSYPLDAAKKAVEASIRIVTIGIGSEQGSPIHLIDPDTGARTLLADRDGVPVSSRLDGELLRQIALATQGAYVPAGVAALDMESIVRGHLEPLARDASDKVLSRSVPNEHYPWFVLGSLLCLFMAVFIGSLTGRSRAI
jgi:Ca-activated chloride channel homolog